MNKAIFDIKKSILIILSCFSFSCSDSEINEVNGSEISDVVIPKKDKDCLPVNDIDNLLLCTDYYHNGVKKRTGKYLDGEAIGKHEFYNDKGNRYLTIDYYPLNVLGDSINQVICFNEDGDTLINDSYYFELAYDKQVKIGTVFHAKFNLYTPHLYNPLIDKQVALYLYKDSLSILQKSSNNYSIDYESKDITPGWNSFEGFLYEQVIKKNGDDTITKDRKYYFTRSFFVE